MREVYHHYIKYNCYDQKRNITKVIYTGCVADEGYFRNTSCVLHNIQFYHINDVYSVVNLCSCLLCTEYRLQRDNTNCGFVCFKTNEEYASRLEEKLW